MSTQEPFSLYRERMLVKVSLRTEKHGDESVNAYDIGLSGPFANAILLKLDPGLRPFLYTQEQGDLIDGQTFNTVRFPELGQFDWALTMPRMTLIIHDEETDRNSLYLDDREADKFNFTLLPGGTVNFGLRVKVGELEEEEDVLKLLRAANHSFLVSLYQAPPETVADNFEQAENLQEPMSDERKAAERAFNAAGAQSPEDVVMAEAE